MYVIRAVQEENKEEPVIKILPPEIKKQRALLEGLRVPPDFKFSENSTATKVITPEEEFRTKAARNNR